MKKILILLLCAGSAHAQESTTTDLKWHTKDIKWLKPIDTAPPPKLEFAQSMEEMTSRAIAVTLVPVKDGWWSIYGGYNGYSGASKVSCAKDERIYSPTKIIIYSKGSPYLELKLMCPDDKKEAEK